jgi:hypothetical protein
MVLDKKGILGKAKLGIKYLEERTDKIENIYLKFRDKSKRKFI